MRNFLTLEFWKRSHLLTLKIYKITTSFPKEELFGLTSQMRRSSSSIPTNIAEGSGRNSNPQFLQFLQIASGSCSEIQYQLILSKDLSYISEEVFNELHSEIIEIRKMIYQYSSRFSTIGYQLPAFSFQLSAFSFQLSAFRTPLTADR